jgi:hypothetical protein
VTRSLVSFEAPRFFQMWGTGIPEYVTWKSSLARS